MSSKIIVIPLKKTKINTYLKRNRALPLKKSKQLDKVLGSSLYPPLMEIVKGYADLPTVEQKPSKIAIFLNNLASQFQRFFRKIYQFFQNQWINIKNKILTKKSTAGDINKTSDLEQNQRQPHQTAPLTPEKAPLISEEPAPKTPETTANPSQAGQKPTSQRK